MIDVDLLLGKGRLTELVLFTTSMCCSFPLPEHTLRFEIAFLHTYILTYIHTYIHTYLNYVFKS